LRAAALTWNFLGCVGWLVVNHLGLDRVVAGVLFWSRAVQNVSLLMIVRCCGRWRPL